MTRAMRFTYLALFALAGCSLATDFDRFHLGDKKGNVMDGGTHAGDGGEGDGDGPGQDAGDLDSGEPKVEGQIDVQLEQGALGTVTSMPAGIDCGEDCSAVYPAGTEVILTANPDPTAAFVGWGGACQGQMGLTCTLTAGEPLTVTAAFTSDWYEVTVSRLGNGSGAVSSTDQMIRCDGTPIEVCVVRYQRGAVVSLVATPTASSGSSFSGWGGACAGEGGCGLMMSDDKVVNAVFDAAGEISLIVSKEGNGQGTVATDDASGEMPPSVSCGSDCAESYSVAEAKVVTLRATPDGSSNFDSFTGCDSHPSATECSVTMDAVKRVKARFNLKKRALDLAWSGEGAGSVVTLLPEELPGCVKPDSCPTGNYDHGTTVKLEAKPAAGSTFKQWSIGACGANPVCEFQLMTDTLVVATFDVQSYAFTPGVVGPAGSSNTLLCASSGADVQPSPCAASYAHGTALTVFAVPSANNELASWGQACAEQPADAPCELVITSATNVLATFEKMKFAVTLSFNSIQGAKGVVSGDLACDITQVDCATEVEHGADFEITAAADPGSKFVSFTGCDATSGENDEVCHLHEVTAAKELSVTFEPVDNTLNTLTVNKVNGHGGTVTSGDGQIDCGVTCAGAYAQNATVTLTMVAEPDFTFEGLSGGGPCIDDSCSVTMDTSKQVTATFAPKNYPLTVLTPHGGNGTGKVTGQIAGIDDGIDCGLGAVDCGASLPFGSTIILTATPGEHSQLTWGGCSKIIAGEGNQPPQCQVDIGQVNQVTAKFELVSYDLVVKLQGDGVGGREPLVIGNNLSCTRELYESGGCKITLTANTMIELTAKAPGWVAFVGFGGACSGNSCSFPLTSSGTVEATFRARGALAFVTSETRSGKLDTRGSGGGAAHGDKICQSIAEGQWLPGVFRAWLSDGDSSPATRFRQLTKSTPVVRFDGEPVMQNGYEQGKPDNPLALDEYGEAVSNKNPWVWTATTPSGEAITVDAPFCGTKGTYPLIPDRPWSTENSFIGYGLGNAMATDVTWTYNPKNREKIYCDRQAHLYCFQDVSGKK